MVGRSKNEVDWTDELIARFRALHASAQHSFAGMAKILSREFHVKLSKNALIGKSRRLALIKRAPVYEQPPERDEEVITARILRGWKVEEPPPREDGLLTVFQLRAGLCHFPRGPAPYGYCGKDAPKGSYCRQHTQLMAGRR